MTTTEFHSPGPYRTRALSLFLSCGLVAIACAALTGGATRSAFGAPSRIRPGVSTCVYDEDVLKAIAIQPPKARSWFADRKTFGKWQAILERKESGGWRRIESTGFDGGYTPLPGAKFKLLAPKQRFSATIREQPSDAYLRIRVEVKWVAKEFLRRRSVLTQDYEGSSSSGCRKQKEGPTPSPSPSPSPSPERGSPLWWGTDTRTSFGATSTLHPTRKGLDPVVGDFDGDGRGDILWYDPAGAEELWWGSSGRSFEVTPSPIHASALDPLAGDFDGDGYDDIYWYAAGARNDVQWWGGPDRAFEVGATSDATGVWDDLVPGDFDGDGYDDIYFYSKADKSLACGDTRNEPMWWGKEGRSSLSVGATAVNLSECYFLPFSIDADGDGIDDLLLYGLAPNGRDALYWGTSTRAFVSDENARFDSALDHGFRPVVGDFDGDGRGDVFWFSPNGADSQWWGIPTGADRKTYGSEALPYRTALSIDGDYYPVSGDFDGDGKHDILWYEK